MIAVAVLFFVATRLLGLARESAQPATVDAKSGAANARSIAVLPFINLSGDSAQAYFTDGITDDLITDLARLPGLLVIARNASFAYKGKQVRPQQIVAALQLKLPDTTGRRETSNPAAYDALLQGLERLRQGSEAETIAAIKAFERAV